MKRNDWRKAIFAILFLPLLSGCWNAKEVEHMFYAHAVGIDYLDGKYNVYVQILDFSTLGKQESSGGKSETTEGAWVGKGQGNTIEAALHNLYKTSQRRIYWGHLNTVILSESVLKLGIHEGIDLLTRFNEFRYTLWIFGTRAPVKDILLASPILEASPVYSQLGDPGDAYKQSSFILPKQLYRLIAEMKEHAKTPLLPMINTVKGYWVDKKQEYSALEVEGYGLIKNGKWNGWLPRTKAKGLRWIERRTARAPLVIGSEKQPVASIIFEHPKHEIVPVVRNGKIYFNLTIRVKGNIIEIGKGASESLLKSKSEKLIREEIRQTYMEGLKQNTDVLNLLDSLYRKQLPEWQRLRQSGKVPLDGSSLQKINVKVNITNSGRTVDRFSDNSN